MIEVTTMTSVPCRLTGSPRNEALPKRSQHRRLRAERGDPASFDDRTLAAGFTELLPKPVDPETLCLTIGKVTGR